MPSPWRPVVAAAFLLPAASAFVVSGSSALSVRSSAASMLPVRRLRSATAVSMSFPAFLPASEMSDIEDEKCVAMACTLQRLPVSMPDFAVSPVATSCAKTSPATPADGAAPLVLLHGFDSSCLEWRRLMPQLEQRNVQAWALDVLGWGFTDRSSSVITDFSPAAKRAHLKAFIDQHVGAPVTLVGASLGGCVAIDFILHHPELVDKLVLVDAQAYIDGAAMTGQPRFLQSLGVSVLKSKPLRMFANKIAYANPDEFGTEDAMRIGRLHTLTGGWEEAMIGFMNSGGYKLSAQVASLPQMDTLILWGRQDKILSPEQYVPKFTSDMPWARLEWVDDCGHVPHLEKAVGTADLIADFLGLS